MEHEIDLGTASDKAAQLNALLFQLSAQRIDPLTDNLIELAHELSDSVACWLIEESTNGGRDMSLEPITQMAIERSKLMDALVRVRMFTRTAQYLTRDESERHIAGELLCQIEDEINVALGGYEQGPINT